MYTDDQLVERYIALRDWLKQEGEVYEQRVAPAKAAMGTIEGELHRLLNERGADKGGTASGTFFKKRSLQLRVADQAAFLTYVFDNRAMDMIPAAANRASVEAFQQQHQCNPPGVETTWVETVQVRRK